MQANSVVFFKIPAIQIQYLLSVLNHIFNSILYNGACRKNNQ